MCVYMRTAACVCSCVKVRLSGVAAAVGELNLRQVVSNQLGDFFSEQPRSSPRTPLWNPAINVSCLNANMMKIARANYSLSHAVGVKLKEWERQILK